MSKGTKEVDVKARFTLILCENMVPQGGFEACCLECGRLWLVSSPINHIFTQYIIYCFYTFIYFSPSQHAQHKLTRSECKRLEPQSSAFMGYVKTAGYNSVDIL